MSANLTDLAQAAITALATFNAERDRQQRSWAQSRFGQSFRGNGPDISDEQQEALLSEIVHYDAEAAETLDTIRFANEPRELIYPGYNPPSDAEWDYAIAKGFAL